MTVTLTKLKKPLIIIGVIVLLVLSIVLSYFIIIKIGENRLRNKLSYTDDKISSSAYDQTEADAYYNGNSYYYNNDLVNILLLGVDKDSIKDKNSKQADAVFLVSFNPKTDEVNVIAISRNTMADIEIYDMNGEFLNTDKAQICLSYAYGKDAAESSLLTCKAVSRLLYNIPINGYYTVYMDSISQIVDSVGGVTVTVPEDLTEVSAKWKKGSTVTITGKDALSYLRHRSDLSEERLQRQKQFISAFAESAKRAVLKDISLPFNMYNKLAKNTVTNVDVTSAVYLASEIVKADLKILQIPGNVGFKDEKETFEPNETALYEQVLDVFYKIKK